MIGIGIVGAGTMGRFHANGYKEISEAEPMAIFDVVEAGARKFAEEYGVRVCSSLDEVLGDPDVGIVDICTPTPSHKEIFIRGLEAGKHLFCEKPLARTLTDAEEMLALSRKGKGKYSVGHVLRFFQEYETIRKLLDAGEVGSPCRARACRCCHLPPAGPAWFADLDASGGVVFDLIIHDFDFLLWCFGDVERVFARGLYERGLPGKDYALATLAFKNGVVAHVEGSWLYPGGFYMSLEVAGSDGLIRYDSRESAPLKVLGGKREEGGEGVEVPESPVRDSPYTRELRSFVNSCLNDTQPEVSLEHAVESLRIADAAYRSIISGKVVEL